MQIVAALILAGGAFFGVWKGAIYAADRLGAQLAEQRDLADRRLDAEAKRLQMQLDAEADRLGRQLEHDRDMRDLEEMRRTFDDLIVSMRDIANLTITLQAIGELGRFAPERLTWDGLDKAREGAMAEYNALDRNLHDRSLRLFLRLKPGDPIFVALHKFQDTSGALVAVYRRSCCDIGDGERVQFLALRDQLSDAQAAFIASSHLLVGASEAAEHFRSRKPKVPPRSDP